MKFLCPSCKAKYQIADEKVIGRTVKMKCRHCGYLIEINEAVTSDARLSSAGSSIAPDAPAETSDSNVVVPAAVASAGRAVSVGRSAAEPLGDKHDVRGRPPPKPGRHASTPEPASAVPKKPAVTVPKPQERANLQGADRPRTSVVPAPRPAPVRQRPDTRVTPTPAESKVGTQPVSDEVSSPTPIGKLPGVSEVSGHVNATRHDALAGAFTKAVASVPATAEPADHPLAGDEWYVGVNDQPIGPIRLAEIRDRAAKGEITPECLVWRDGFEDWKPLTAFPELVAVVEDGIGSLRSMRPPPAREIAAAAPAVVLAPAAAAAQPVVPSIAELPSAAEADSYELPGVSKPKIPIAAWFAVAMALVLGVTIGLVLMKPEPPKEIVKYVEVPVSAKPGIGDVAPPPAPPDGIKEGAEAANSEGAASEKRAGSAAARRATGAASAESPNGVASTDTPSQGLKGLQGLQGLGAPRTGPASEVGASASGRQQLDSATLSRTVSRYTASVKRSCWQPALDTRAPDASTTARISANIVVAPSGKVQSVTVSPDPKGYRGLSSCIQARVRNWEFPPAGGSTEFNVPFVFAAQ